jgi:hypothetical protein
LLFYEKNLEGGAAPLELEPFARELRQALALELGEAAFEAGFLPPTRAGDRGSILARLAAGTGRSSRISACGACRSRAVEAGPGSSSRSADRRHRAGRRARHLVGATRLPPALREERGPLRHQRLACRESRSR